MKKIYLAAGAFLFAGVALAYAQVPPPVTGLTITWDPPTARVDGSPLDASELRETRLYEHRVLTKVIPMPTITAPFFPQPGKSYVWEATAVDRKGLQSDFSEPLVWAPTPVPSIPAVPNPPSDMKFK